MKEDILHTVSLPAPEWNLKEVLRYAGCRKGDQDVESLAADCMKEAAPLLCYRACWRRYPVRKTETGTHMGFMETASETVRRNLDGCRELILFAATVGIGIDRLIARYGRISPSRALMMQAIGAERIESLCDELERMIKEETWADGLAAGRRFSPGYGDFPLESQREIFRVLDCPRQLGLSLNESLLMSPSKSVTAVLGLGGTGTQACGGKCAGCGKTDCTYRAADRS